MSYADYIAPVPWYGKVYLAFVALAVPALFLWAVEASFEDHGVPPRAPDATELLIAHQQLEDEIFVEEEALHALETRNPHAP